MKTKSRSVNKKRHSVIEVDSDSDEPTPKRLKDDAVMGIERIESNVEDILTDPWKDPFKGTSWVAEVLFLLKT